jgi:ribonuclease HI
MQATLYFDGSLRRKVMYGGYVALVFTDPIIVGAGCESCADCKTSNDAEWFALLSGLEWVTKIRGLEQVSIRGDSLSVLDGLKQKVKTRRASSRDFRDQCLDILERKSLKWSAGKIDRKQNVFAHRLSRGAESGAALGNDEGYYNPSQVKLLHLLAESLWRQAGKPDGRDIEFWVEAEQLFFDSVTPYQERRGQVRITA